MGENLAKGWKDRAIYIPAIQKGYSSFCTRNKKNVRDGKWPAKLNPSDLNILNDKSKLFHTAGCLYSMGQHDHSHIRNGMLNRNRADGSFVIGDSGGYQIAKGTLGAIKAWDGNEPDKVYNTWLDELDFEYGVMGKLVRALDLYTDYAATVEIADWCVNEAKSPFRNLKPEQLIDLTFENLKFTEKYSGKIGRKTKWLNVLHGGFDKGVDDAWYQTVRQIKFSGWALGGNFGHRGGIFKLVCGLLLLQEDKELDHAEWLHVLGVSKLHWAVLLTACLKGLRKAGHGKINLSYDTSTGSISLANGMIFNGMPELGNNTGQSSWNGWALPVGKVPDDHRYVTSKDNPVFPVIDSPLNKLQITLKDLNVQARDEFANKFDNLSNQLLTNHNYYMIINAFQYVNDVAFGKDEQKKAELIPEQLLEAIEVIQAALTDQNCNGRSILDKNKDLLDAVGKAQSI